MNAQQLGLLDGTSITILWDRLVEFLDKDPTMWNLQFNSSEELLGAAMNEKIYLWLAGDEQKMDFVCIVSITKPIFYIHGIVGRNFLNHLSMLVEQSKALARVCGCDKIQIWTSRRGLQRALLRVGYEIDRVRMTLDASVKDTIQ